jgi:hypothetical protein
MAARTGRPGDNTTTARLMRRAGRGVAVHAVAAMDGPFRPPRPAVESMAFLRGLPPDDAPSSPNTADADQHRRPADPQHKGAAPPCGFSRATQAGHRPPPPRRHRSRDSPRPGTPTPSRPTQSANRCIIGPFGLPYTPISVSVSQPVRQFIRFSMYVHSAKLDVARHV